MVMARARLLSCPFHFLMGQTETPLREEWGFVLPRYSCAVFCITPSDDTDFHCDGAGRVMGWSISPT